MMKINALGEKELEKFAQNQKYKPVFDKSKEHDWIGIVSTFMVTESSLLKSIASFLISDMAEQELDRLPERKESLEKILFSIREMADFFTKGLLNPMSNQKYVKKFEQQMKKKMRVYYSIKEKEFILLQPILLFLKKEKIAIHQDGKILETNIDCWSLDMK